jgi:multidrug efflux pump
MLGGRRVTRFKKGSEQYDVIVQVADQARQTPEELANIYIRGADGSMVQMSNVVDVTETVAAKELNHFNKLRAATVSAGLAPGYTQAQALDWLEEALHQVAPTAQYDLAGSSREFRASSAAAYVMMGLSLVFIFLVLAAQFESWVDPLIILSSVPLAVFGAFLTLVLLNFGTGFHLWHMAMSWNIYTQIGIVTLIGLIAKHGILIVEFANQLQAAGRTKAEAALESAGLRLRPILMTTGAMVLGSIPLAIASGAGAEGAAPDRLGDRRRHELRHAAHAVRGAGGLHAAGAHASRHRGRAGRSRAGALARGRGSANRSCRFRAP